MASSNSVEARISAGVSVAAGQDPRHEVYVRVIRPVEADVLEARGVLAVVVECRGAPGAGLAARLLVETVVRHFERGARNGEDWLVRALEAGCEAVRGAAGRLRFMRGVTVSGVALLLHQGVAHGAFIGSTPLYLARGRTWYRLSGDEVTQPLSRAMAVTWAQPLMIDATDRFLLCNRALSQAHRSSTEGGSPSGPAFRTTPPTHHPQLVCDALIAEARAIERQAPLATALLAVEENGTRSGHSPLAL